MNFITHDIKSLSQPIIPKEILKIKRFEEVVEGLSTSQLHSKERHSVHFECLLHTLHHNREIFSKVSDHSLNILNIVEIAHLRKLKL